MRGHKSLSDREGVLLYISGNGPLAGDFRELESDTFALKYDGKNYYLDLATHEDGLGDRAKDLAKKLRDGCAAEFPFLF